MPCSATGFTPGNSSLAFDEVTAIAFSLPLSISGRDAVTVSIVNGICPPITSVIELLDPLYGTPNSGALLRSFRNSNTRRAVVLGSAMSTDLGFAFAAANSSATELTGAVGLAEITIGNVPVRMIGSKSFSASKPVLAYRN